MRGRRHENQLVRSSPCPMPLAGHIAFDNTYNCRPGNGLLVVSGIDSGLSCGSQLCPRKRGGGPLRPSIRSRSTARICGTRQRPISQREFVDTGLTRTTTLRTMVREGVIHPLTDAPPVGADVVANTATNATTRAIWIGIREIADFQPCRRKPARTIGDSRDPVSRARPASTALPQPPSVEAAAALVPVIIELFAPLLHGAAAPCQELTL